MSEERRTSLTQVLGLYEFDQHGRFQLSPQAHETIRSATTDPLYALSPNLIELIRQQIPGVMTADEAQHEIQFTDLCTRLGSLGLFLGKPFTHYPLSRPPLPDLTPDVLRWIGMDQHTSPAAANNSMRLARETLDPLVERIEAYLGWLITNRTFIEECVALRERWGDVIRRAGSLPQRASGSGMQFREIPGRRISVQSLLSQFAAFYRRWEIAGFATWDLPSPVGGNIGGSVAVSRLAGVDERPAVQTSAVLRVPHRSPIDNLETSPPIDHLSEWRQVQDQRHPNGLSYQRLRRIFRLHVTLNVFLRSRYGDRFRRRTEQLDRLMATFLGDSDQQTIAWSRRWILRKLSATG